MRAAVVFIVEFKEGTEVSQGWLPGWDQQVFDPTARTQAQKSESLSSVQWTVAQ